MPAEQARELPERVVVDYDELYLTEYSVYKTESFSLATAKLVNVNVLLTHLAFAALKAGISEGRFSFSSSDVKLYADFDPAGREGATVVYYDFKSYPVTGDGDTRLRGVREWRVERAPAAPYPRNKLYRTFSDRVNLPLLNEEQERIVRSEGKNLLVQGIAGSGKTNVCIDKILFAAVSSYRGKTLYSTFSRGLLLDVRRKVEEYTESLRALLSDLKKGNVRTTTTEILAVTRVIGMPLRSEDTVTEEIERVIAYLSEKVDYLLPEDIYRKTHGEFKRADEDTFRRFLREMKNYNLAQRGKKHDISAEVLYKEVYGFIFGRACGAELSKEEYVARRAGTFTKAEAEYVYDLSEGYRAYLAETGHTDLNVACAEMSRELTHPEYSLAVLDEVQDFTRVQLEFFRDIAIKLFCVGDASQMVNPAYFSFAALKDLLYRQDVTEVSELKYNYRNSKEIADIVMALAKLNRETFGVHGFVLDAEAVSREEGSFAVSFRTGDFIERMKKEVTDNFTVVVSSQAEKENLRAALPLKEILTVSEIKGLERDTVVLYNVLSSNKDKFERLAKTELDRKSADENSLYRYYFNLFYVGVSRARRHLFVAEATDVPQFTAFFRENFEHISAEDAVLRIKETVGSTLVEQEEYKRRAAEFMKLGQYDNAENAARSLINDRDREKILIEIGIWRDYIASGDYVNAGIAYWEHGYLAEAREYFELVGEHDLSAMVDATVEEGEDARLDYRVVSYFEKLKGNAAAMRVLGRVIDGDLETLRKEHREISSLLKKVNKKTKGAS